MGELGIRLSGLAMRHGLNRRQALALGYVRENDSITTAEFHEMQPEMTRRTLQRDLNVLINAGLIARRGGTNQAEYALSDGAS